MIKTYALYHNSEIVNTIVADDTFIKEYCSTMGYTYKEINSTSATNINKCIIENNVENIEIPDAYQENKFLKAQLKAQTERSDFIEDCIAEMAGVIYNTEETTT